MKNSIKKIIVGFLYIVMICNILACNKKEDVSSNYEEEAIIKYRYWVESKEQSQLMSSIINNFNSTNNKNIKVVGEEVEYNEETYYEQILLDKNEGQDFDVASVELKKVSFLVNNNQIYDISSFMKKWDGKKDINDNIDEMIKNLFNKKSIYVMPFTSEPYYIYYRPTYFEKFGVSLPTNYDEFLECCKNVAWDIDGNGVIDIPSIAFFGKEDMQKVCGSFIYANGGSFDNINSEKSIKGMEDFINLYKNGYISDISINGTKDEINEYFRKGNFAMFYNKHGEGTKFNEYFLNDISAFQFPKGINHWTYMDGIGNVVLNDCKNKKAAFEWMKYLAVLDGQRMWCDGTGNITISKSIGLNDNFQNDIFLKIGVDCINSVNIIDTNGKEEKDFSNKWYEIVSLGLKGNFSAKEVCDKLFEELYSK